MSPPAARADAAPEEQVAEPLRQAALPPGAPRVGPDAPAVLELRVSAAAGRPGEQARPPRAGWRDRRHTSADRRVRSAPATQPEVAPGTPASDDATRAGSAARLEAVGRDVWGAEAPEAWPPAAASPAPGRNANTEVRHWALLPASGLGGPGPGVAVGEGAGDDPAAPGGRWVPLPLPAAPIAAAGADDGLSARRRAGLDAEQEAR